MVQLKDFLQEGQKIIEDNRKFLWKENVPYATKKKAKLIYSSRVTPKRQSFYPAKTAERNDKQTLQQW
jgi:hypothetical protein